MGRSYEQIRKDNFKEQAEAARSRASEALEQIDGVLATAGTGEQTPPQRSLNERLHTTGDFLLQLDAIV